MRRCSQSDGHIVINEDHTKVDRDDEKITHSLNSSCRDGRLIHTGG